MYQKQVQTPPFGLFDTVQFLDYTIDFKTTPMQYLVLYFPPALNTWTVGVLSYCFDVNQEYILDK